ncbi:hypothetical protein CEXT_595161 [Caerostris extrusa]|uniref:Uncharacterized protein n=1 Tax=Caerostris extrusa TaxID=172846 RepID=A0AAV4PHC5_CAEEX|nr:hypothetical protein CEXT_595161 [Caerostris extrusa]
MITIHPDLSQATSECLKSEISMSAQNGQQVPKLNSSFASLCCFQYFGLSLYRHFASSYRSEPPWCSSNCTPTDWVREITIEQDGTLTSSQPYSVPITRQSTTPARTNRAPLNHPLPHTSYRRGMVEAIEDQAKPDSTGIFCSRDGGAEGGSFNHTGWCLPLSLFLQCPPFPELIPLLALPPTSTARAMRDVV